MAIADAIIVPCASRKSILPVVKARAQSLPKLRQAALQTAWTDRLTSLPRVVKAEALYTGRGFGLATKTAETLGVPLYIISAGLGLVPGSSVVPSYGITVSGRGDDAVARRVNGRFCPEAWWNAVTRGPYSSPMAGVFEGDGLVLTALSQPYARMIGAALAALPDDCLSRLRICGLSIAEHLPERVRSVVLSYDERLHGIIPGTRTDFAQRALFHFSTEVLVHHPTANAAEHSRCVQAALQGKKAVATVDRARLPDDRIIDAITQRLNAGESGIQRTLRALRHKDGIGCEQARFSRLYKHAESRRSSP